MLEKWLISIVISFILRQVAKFKDQIDWKKVRLDLETRVRDLVPGTWFDDDAAAIVDVVLAKVQAALSQTEALGKLLTLLANSDWAGALAYIKELLKHALPSAAESKASLALAS